jgi:hypothetical protein
LKFKIQTSILLNNKVGLILNSSSNNAPVT